MGQYADVITEGNKIVSACRSVRGMQQVLSTNLIQALSTTFTTYTTVESILSMPFTALDLPGTQNSLEQLLQSRSER